jgi:hypothetical protein
LLQIGDEVLAGVSQQDYALHDNQPRSGDREPEPAGAEGSGTRPSGQSWSLRQCATDRVESVWEIPSVAWQTLADKFRSDLQVPIPRLLKRKTRLQFARGDGSCAQLWPTGGGPYHSIAEPYDGWVVGQFQFPQSRFSIPECGIMGHESNGQDDSYRRGFLCPRSSQLRPYASHAPFLKVAMTISKGKAPAPCEPACQVECRSLHK